MRRFQTLVVVFLVALMMSAGCASTSSSSADPKTWAQKVDDALDATAPAYDVVMISAGVWYRATPASSRREAVRDQIVGAANDYRTAIGAAKGAIALNDPAKYEESMQKIAAALARIGELLRSAQATAIPPGGGN